jgi:hypothetical protein
MAGEIEVVADAGADTGAAAGEGVDAGVAPQAGAKPATPAPKRWKYKADGKDLEEELTEEQVTQRLSLSHAAQKRMAEAARERKEAAAEREAAKQERAALEAAKKGLAGDPAALRKFLREQLGDPEKAHDLLISVMKAEIADRNLDPRERELAELKAEKAAREAADKEASEKSAKEQHEAKVSEAVGKHREVFVKRLGAIMDLKHPTTGRAMVPQNDATLAIAANVYMENVRGKMGLSEQEMAEAVRGETVAAVADFTEGWTGEDWEANHPAIYRAIVSHAAGKVRSRQQAATGETRREGPAVRAKPLEGSEASDRIPPPKPLSRREWNTL